MKNWMFLFVLCFCGCAVERTKIIISQKIGERTPTIHIEFQPLEGERI